ncbi:hypothetical protein [Massilia sp. DD77]|uniref:hypothetical protein n=1 Tax=Massilia sp. DD77 TaxID=3109349 RepID=UPI002FFE5DB0
MILTFLRQQVAIKHNLLPENLAYKQLFPCHLISDVSDRTENKCAADDASRAKTHTAQCTHTGRTSYGSSCAAASNTPSHGTASTCVTTITARNHRNLFKRQYLQFNLQ